ncbi:hypothetical protein WJX79_004991 [Trebouxia sp. C0005]
MAAEGPSGLHSGMAPEGDQIEQTPGEIHNHGPELDLKSKKAPTGARARSIKTPLQREALEAAFLINQFPAEEVRRALGDRIQLTENQVQVWFSHKRRKDKKSQQATAPAATTAVSNGIGTSSAVPVASPSEAPVAFVLSANSTPAAAPSHIPIASLPSFSTYLEKPAASAQASQLPVATTIPKPVAAVMASTASAAAPPAVLAQSMQLPASVHVPSGQLNGTAAFLGHSLPVDLQPSAYQELQAESTVRSQAQPVFHPEARIPTQTQALSQAHRLSTAFPRQFLPNQYPPQSFVAAQKAARLAPGITVSNFQPSLPVQPSPVRPIASQTLTPAAAPSSATATPASWLAARSSPIVSEAHLPSPAARPASEAAYANDSHPQSMHEDSDAGTEEFETAHEDRVVHAEHHGNDADDAGGAVTRKRVMVDGFEMEEDGEDGMHFKKARLNPNQIRRPPSAGKGGKEDAERRAYREAERAHILAKRVEQTMMKDKERMEREKKRVKEKLEREKKKDEVAQSKAAEKLRQFHEREAKKAAERAEKEKRAEERKRLQDEKRREKELLRALAAQERQATRLRQRDVNTGPKDDLDIEWEQLMEAHHQAGYGSGTEDQPDQGTDTSLERPEFPPTSLNLVPAFAADLPQKQGSDMLMVAAFLQSFSGLLGLSPVTVDNLLAAVVNGEQSQLLGQIHIALLRLLQMDLEEAHATGAIQGGGATNFMDRAIINCAHALEEAWAWGFDVDVWRAHLNAQTWPEVLRQYSIAMGLGQKRPKPGQQPRRKPKMGTEGEDIVKDEAGRVTLVAPARFGLGTVKGAAYKVLQDVGPEGLAIPEIARRIQEQGLRDLTTSKTPEASVAGALSRDVIFARVAPSIYALKANIALHKSGANAVKAEIKAEELKTEGGQTEVKAEPVVQATAQDNGVKAEARQHQHEEDDDTGSEGDSDEDEEYETKADAGESWLQHLKTHEYDDLSFEQRVNCLKMLVHLALDGPAVRASLDGRIEEAQRVRKQMWEEAKIEKRLRQQEAAEKAKKSAQDAQRALDAYNASTDSPAHDPVPPAHTVEAALPLSAMKDAVWNSEVWQAAVKGAQSALQLRQALGQLESAVHEGFLWQSHVQPRQPLLVKGAWMPIGSSASVMVQQPMERPLSAAPVAPAAPNPTSEYLTWLPATCSAVSLRLFALDSAIIYRPGDQPGRETLQAYRYIQRPSSTPMPGSKSVELHEPRASLHTTSGAPVSQGGRAKHSLFPPFPQAVLQGPRQSFRLPVADFKQAVLDAQNGVEGPGSSGTGLKVRLPMGKRSSVGHASKQKGQPRGARNKPPGQSRSSTGNGKARSKKAGRVQSLQQQASADMDLDELTARSNTATPGLSEDDVQSLGRSAEDSDDDEPEISSEDEQQHNNSDVELSD